MLAADTNILTDSKMLYGYPLSDASLYRVTRSLELLETDMNPSLKALQNAAIDTLAAIVHDSIIAYYKIPAEKAEVSPFIRRFADSTITLIKSAVNVVIKTVFSRLNDQEIKEIVGYQKTLLWTEPETNKKFVKFPLTDDLSTKLLYYVEIAVNEEDMSAHIDTICACYGEIFQLATTYYYHNAMSIVNVNSLTKRIADKGINKTLGLMETLLKKVLPNLSSSAFIDLAVYTRSLIHHAD